MKAVKLSLAAALVASSAFAIDNVKVDGQLKLWYQTAETGTATSPNLFDSNGGTGDFVAKLRVQGDLTSKVSFGLTGYGVTTLGLENNLVSDEAIKAGNTGGTLNGEANNPTWIGEAYMVYKAGNTIAKIGRQELDTPLAFTETWNAAPNTFEAAVLVNKDLPDTTLVAAYVARGNGFDNTLAVNKKTVLSTFNAYHTAAGANDTGGAYAAGMVNKSIPNLTLHPVYYSVTDTANAFWVDATYVVPGAVKLEAIYANLAPVGATEAVIAGTTDVDTTAYAAQVSGEVSGVKLAASYSAVSEGFLPVANTATGFKKTKLYTASIFSDGEVAAKPDTKSWKVDAKTSVAGFDLGASYGSYDVGTNNGKQDFYSTAASRGTGYNPTEIDLSIGTKIDDINVVAYYINQSDFNKDKQDRQAVRVIASINF